MLQNMNINGSQWGALMADFIQDSRNGVPDNRKDQTSMRGNLTKEFARPQMTWKVFCKAMRFLKFWKVEIYVKTYPVKGAPMWHSTTVNFGSVASLLNELEEEDAEDEEDGHELEDDPRQMQLPLEITPDTRSGGTQ
jgi:hypothetical protein